MYWLEDGLVWKEPEDENAHIEIALRVTLVDERGHELGTQSLSGLASDALPPRPQLGRCLRQAPTYRMRVEFDAPRFERHDEVNGRRYAEPGRVEFDGVWIDL